MIEILKNGGPLMVPIILCGILALFIIIERIHYYVSVKKRDKVFLEKLDAALDAGDFSAAVAACIESDTPCAKVIRAALDCRSYDEAHLKEIVRTRMDTVIPKFEHLLTALGTIANVSTLLGLLGTVTGNIKAFGVLGSGGSMGDPAVLANAIAEALVTTVAGLCVAIPSLVFHNAFNNIVSHRICDMEAAVTQVVFRLIGKESK
ncbi:MAG: MotA/TolQ/ExbB proton channel family protein [Treponema sp.]|nr:MotA/TolQ/ExbB proton channel family protein [Treponema sp.]